jgi:dephospho-CoA kinase
MSARAGRKVVIGVTGNIACGKTLVLDTLRELGAETIDADRIAHGVMRAGTPTFRQIVERFGKGVVGEDGELNRRALGTIVFSDPAELRALEEIVHPPTDDTIKRQIRESTHQVVVVDAIKLYEVHLDEVCDETWVVTCTPEQQLERLMRRNGFPREEALKRINAQPPAEEKVARADRVIDNSGTQEETITQVRRAWEEITAR